jgi:hypothetical protein
LQWYHETTNEKGISPKSYFLKGKTFLFPKIKVIQGKEFRHSMENEARDLETLY